MEMYLAVILQYPGFESFLSAAHGNLCVPTRLATWNGRPEWLPPETAQHVPWARLSRTAELKKPIKNFSQKEKRNPDALLAGSLQKLSKSCKFFGTVTVPDKRSRDIEVVVVRRIINLGTGNLEWGGNGKGLRKGKSVYE